MNSSMIISRNENRPMLSVYACAFMLIIHLSRIQEIFPLLLGMRLALISLAITVLLSLLNGRLNAYVLGSSKESKLMVAFWLLGLFSIVFSVWPGGAFRIWKVVFTTNILIFFCCLVNMGNEKELLILTWSMIASALFLGSGTLIFSAPMVTQRLSVTAAYDPNDLAMILVTLVPFAIACFFSGKLTAKLFSGITIIVMLIALFKTGSRGGFIGLLAVGVFFLLTSFSRITKFKKFVVLALVIAVSVSVASQSLWDRFGDVLSGQDYNLRMDDDEVVGRLEIWKSGLELLLKKPILGVGPGQFATAMGLTHGQYSWLTAHNSFLQVALELGLPGLLVFLLLISRSWLNSQTAQLGLVNAGRQGFILDLAVSNRIALVGYVACAMFLSQAYSVLVPIIFAHSSALADMVNRQISVEEQTFKK